MGSPLDEEGRLEDEGPQHEVTLTKGFYLADAPCTQGLWKAVTGENPSHFRGDEQPVERVSWSDVGDCLAQLNVMVPGLSVRLPSEAEWEYACRAGSTDTRYGELDAVAWHRGNSGRETHPVKQKAANAWGLYDMLGNVWEWCSDGVREYAATAETDPSGSLERGSPRALRGGSWDDYAGGVRAADRSEYEPDGRNRLLGFRVARGQLR